MITGAMQTAIRAWQPPVHHDGPPKHGWVALVIDGVWPYEIPKRRDHTAQPLCVLWSAPAFQNALQRVAQMTSAGGFGELEQHMGPHSQKEVAPRSPILLRWGLRDERDCGHVGRGDELEGVLQYLLHRARVVWRRNQQLHRPREVALRCQQQEFVLHGVTPGGIETLLQVLRCQDHVFGGHFSQRRDDAFHSNGLGAGFLEPNLLKEGNRRRTSVKCAMK
mmetsp:Transcript_242/g.371  ORF Transcript_242/g.371 Transcript_242/m.371 type:complete len:221 (+) Transcript_242:3236-3898(+)